MQTGGATGNYEDLNWRRCPDEFSCEISLGIEDCTLYKIRSALDGRASQYIDTFEVCLDIEKIIGKNTVQELHIWGISTRLGEGIVLYCTVANLLLPLLATQNKSVASLHVAWVQIRSAYVRVAKDQILSYACSFLP
jgi:hypothetical protein